ncbi:MAG TPA: hypothetical protein ENK57_24445, partial [Polyangiaceae bacterium]|nr:hypothetical protein [Polyangiaceae bacterium]
MIMKMHVKVALTALMVATFFAMILSDDASAQSSNQPTLTGVSISRGSGSNMDVTLSYRPPKTGPRPKVYEYWMMRPGQSYPGTKIGQSNAPSKRKLRLPSSKL